MSQGGLLSLVTLQVSFSALVESRVHIYLSCPLGVLKFKEPKSWAKPFYHGEAVAALHIQPVLFPLLDGSFKITKMEGSISFAWARLEADTILQTCWVGRLA